MVTKIFNSSHVEIWVIGLEEGLEATYRPNITILVMRLWGGPGSHAEGPTVS